MEVKEYEDREIIENMLDSCDEKQCRKMSKDGEKKFGEFVKIYCIIRQGVV